MRPLRRGATNMPGVGTILSVREGEDSRFVHTDVQGTTRNVTSAAEAVMATYDLDAFGVQRSHTGAYSTPYLFTGKERDSGPSLDYFIARQYKAGRGVFVSLGSIRFGPRYGILLPRLSAPVEGWPLALMVLHLSFNDSPELPNDQLGPAEADGGAGEWLADAGTASIGCPGCDTDRLPRRAALSSPVVGLTGPAGGYGPVAPPPVILLPVQTCIDRARGITGSRSFRQLKRDTRCITGPPCTEAWHKVWYDRLDICLKPVRVKYWPRWCWTCEPVCGWRKGWRTKSKISTATPRGGPCIIRREGRPWNHAEEYSGRCDNLRKRMDAELRGCMEYLLEGYYDPSASYGQHRVLERLLEVLVDFRAYCDSRGCTYGAWVKPARPTNSYCL